MPNDEDKKLMIKHNMINRAPGKRQIKPTAYLLNCDIPLDDDDDDMDFHAPAAAPETKETATKSGEEDGADDDKDDEGSSDSDEDDSDEDEEESEEESEVGERMAAGADEMICSVCMNLLDFLPADTIIQCDRCGIQVHEGCYGGVFLEDQNGQSNSESWFCEPCLFLADDLHCELCPSKSGAFKLSEFPGQYIHMACALFTENVTWADNQKLIGCSYQEVKHKLFGRKGCAGCSEWTESRTGVASRCELGECSNYYHVTCAQKLGLLVESSEEVEGPVAHPRFIACKKHNRNSDKVKKQKDLYSRWLARENQRANSGYSALSPQFEKDRLMLKEKLEQDFATLTGVSITKPDPYSSQSVRQRYVRLLHTSSRVLEGFKLKAKLYRPLNLQNGAAADESSVMNGSASVVESKAKEIARLTRENEKLASTKKMVVKARDKAIKEHEKYNQKYKQRKLQAKKKEEKDNLKLNEERPEAESSLKNTVKGATSLMEAMEDLKAPMQLFVPLMGVQKKATIGREERMKKREEEKRQREQAKKEKDEAKEIETPSPKRRRPSEPVIEDEESNTEEEFIILPD